MDRWTARWMEYVGMIYLRARIQRLARHRLAFGYVFAAICVAIVNRDLFLPGIAVALAGVGIRIWAAGCLQKNHQLATTGPYSLCRNPLYLGSVILGTGAIMAVQAWWLLPIYYIGFALFYWPTIQKEEQHLLERFGDDFTAYKERVPVFLPLRLRAVTTGFSLANVMRNREHRHALVWIAFLLLLETVEEIRDLLSQGGT